MSTWSSILFAKSFCHSLCKLLHFSLHVRHPIPRKCVYLFTLLHRFYVHVEHQRVCKDNVCRPVEHQRVSLDFGAPKSVTGFFGAPKSVCRPVEHQMVCKDSFIRSNWGGTDAYDRRFCKDNGAPQDDIHSQKNSELALYFFFGVYVHVEHHSLCKVVLPFPLQTTSFYPPILRIYFFECMFTWSTKEFAKTMVLHWTYTQKNGTHPLFSRNALFSRNCFPGMSHATQKILGMSHVTQKILGVIHVAQKIFWYTSILFLVALYWVLYRLRIHTKMSYADYIV